MPGMKKFLLLFNLVGWTFYILERNYLNSLDATSHLEQVQGIDKILNSKKSPKILGNNSSKASRLPTPQDSVAEKLSLEADSIFDLPPEKARKLLDKLETADSSDGTESEGVAEDGETLTDDGDTIDSEECLDNPEGEECLKNKEGQAGENVSLNEIEAPFFEALGKKNVSFAELEEIRDQVKREKLEMNIPLKNEERLSLEEIGLLEMEGHSEINEMEYRDLLEVVSDLRDKYSSAELRSYYMDEIRPKLMQRSPASKKGIKGQNNRVNDQ